MAPQDRGRNASYLRKRPEFTAIIWIGTPPTAKM
jgi:hypothetical protein